MRDELRRYTTEGLVKLYFQNLSQPAKAATKHSPHFGYDHILDAEILLALTDHNYIDHSAATWWAGWSRG